MSAVVRCAVVMAFLVVSGFPWSSRGAEQPRASGAASWSERFQEEAPRAWDEYRRRAKRFQGSFSATFVSVGDRRVMLQRRAEIKQREGCALYTEQTLKADNEKDLTGETRVSNPGYRFELRRKSPEAEWTVLNLILPPGSEPRFRPPEEDVEQWATCPINLVLALSDPAPVLPTDPGYRLNGVNPVAREGREWARVEFEYRPPQGKPRVPSLAGWALYDPDRYWVIGAFDLQLALPAVQGAPPAAKTALFEYRDAGAGFPILQRIVCQFKNPAQSKSFGREDTYDFDLREADVPESDFTLSAFGFPDPVGSKPPERPRTWLWLLVAAAGLAALAVLFAGLKRRAARRTAQAQPSPNRGAV
jgi:hypothetical protein